MSVKTAFLALFSVFMIQGIISKTANANIVTMSAVANTAPTLILTAPFATLDPNKNESYSRVPTATDPDGDTLTFSITNKPEWISFNTSTGAMTGTPTTADSGSVSGIVITVTDGIHSVSSTAFTISVLDENGEFELDQCYTDSFVGTGGLDDTWQVLASQGFTPTSVVVNNQSRLRLTDTGKTRAGGVSKAFPIPAVGINQFEFLAAAHGGDGADGIAFVLSDWTISPAVGVQGHGLGYSSSDSTEGFKGGWLAVGIDEWGNFSEPTRHNGTGGPGITKNSISIRGSGDKLVGYNYLTGTGSLSPALDGHQDGYLYRITLDSSTQAEAYLTVERDIGSGYQVIIDKFDVLSDSSQAQLPDQFRVSFTASTGASTNFHDVTLLKTTGSDCASVLSVSLTQGVVNLDEGTATFLATLNIPAPTSGVQVDFATVDGSALNSSEYTTQSGSLSFVKGESFKQITVPLLSLDASDNGKDFFVRLSNPTNAYIATGSNSAKLKITANNNPPVATSDSYSVSEGKRLKGSTVLANDTDSDSDTLTAVLLTKPSHGSLLLDSDGTFVYVHDGSETASDSFTYKANDGQSNSNVVTVNIGVNSVNEAPVAVSDSRYSVNEDQLLSGGSVLDNDNDPDGDSLTAVLVSSVGNGTLTLNDNGTFVYDHDGSETTLDSFTYKANDGSLDSNIVKVTINVNPVNDAPVAVDDNYAINQGIRLNGQSVLVNDSDAEGDSLTAVLTSDVSHGDLTFNTNGTFVYTHDGSRNAIDSFTYQANDGSLDSNVVKVTINVNLVNNAPRALDDTYSLEQGSSFEGSSVLNNDNDEDGDSLTATLVSSVSNGSLTLNSDGTFTYVHDGGDTNSDSFVYRANDGLLSSNTATVTFTLTEAAPIAVPDNYTINEGGRIDSSSVLANDSDPDGDDLTASLVENVSYGSLTLNPNGTFTYIHDGGETKQDSFSYKANDGELDSNTVAVTITVEAVNDAPIAEDLTLVTNEDESLRLQLAATDPDGDNLTFTLVSQPANGRLRGAAPNLTYVPNANFNGEDSFTYQVSDGELNSNIASVQITVNPIDEQNLPPIANDDEFEFEQSQPLTLDVLRNDTDPEGQALTLTAAYSNFGDIAVVDNKVVFTPTAGLSGRFTVNYSITDNAGNVATAVALVKITTNQGPIITLPQDLCGEFVVQANALHTRVELGEASAVDRFGNSVPVSLVDGVSLFPPGVNEVFWSATDSSGNTTIEAQLVCVMPLISIEKDQTVLGGDAATVGVYLNGESPVYPVVVPFEISGSATQNDHDLISGELVITKGTESYISLHTFANNNDDIDNDKTLTVQLADSLNLGAKNSHDLVITNGNIAPEVMLTVTQQNQQRLTVTKTGGLVEISTILQDPNLENDHSLTWTSSNAALSNLSEKVDEFHFDPENIDLGLYQVTLLVVDNGQPQLSDLETVYIEVVDALLEFTDPALDTDGDLIPDEQEGYADRDGDGIPDYLDKITECNVLQEQSANQDSYLVEGQPGVCLRRGLLSIGGQSGGAEITTQDIARDATDALEPDLEATNIGGVFDYIVYGLPEQGNNYAIVMPQKRPVPVDAVYRKYRPNSGWGFFIEDQNNTLWSTQGEPGHCPPPALNNQNNVWQPGLNEGHWCVQQIIEDGGVNDDDGLINGSIADPGGVSVMLNDNSIPIAMDDSLSMMVGDAIDIDVLANDTDADGDELTLTSAAANVGTVTIIDNKLYYQAASGYAGDITIDYGITDNRGGTDHAIVNITMMVNFAPTVTNEQSEINQGESVTTNLLINDIDPESDTLTLIQVANANVSFDSNGEATFTPPADFFGNMTINYTITDTAGNQAQGQWLVNVIQVHQLAAQTEGGGSINFSGLLLLALLLCWRNKIYSLVRNK